MLAFPAMSALPRRKRCERPENPRVLRAHSKPRNHAATRKTRIPALVSAPGTGVCRASGPVFDIFLPKAAETPVSRRFRSFAN